MISKTITFSAEEQDLTREDGVFEYASNTVEYIKASFTLGTGWTDLDSVRAIWTNRNKAFATILFNGECSIPTEVLAETGMVQVNLVGSVYEDGELTDRITTFPINALIVTKAALVDDGTKVTPSEFEQFVARVEDAAAKADGAEEAAERAEDAAEDAEHSAQIAIQVKNMTVSAETLSPGAQATVTKTEFGDALHLEFGIPTGAQGPKGETGETGSKGDTGDRGIRGSGWLTLRHAPTRYTEPIGEIVPGFRILLSTVLEDSGFSEVVVGDRLIRTDYSTLPAYSVLYVDDEWVYTTTPNDVRGPKGDQGDKGNQGDDYVLTAQDKQDIADIVISELPTWTGGSY